MLPGWTQDDIPFDHGCFHCYRTGAQGKPPLVLVHGFSDSGLCHIRFANYEAYNQAVKSFLSEIA